LTLITGGAKSGKSRFAERLVTESGLRRLYLATAQVWDAEMRVKVDAHLADRGPGWHTLEAPRDIAAALHEVGPADAVLLDCATMWLTNVMLAEQDVPAACAVFVQAMADCAAPVVVVSNEVGQGIVPDNALARRFRNAQGALNQAIAGQADRVVAVMAGLPLVLK